MAGRTYAQWKLGDPILKLRKQSLENGWASLSEFEAIDADVKQIVEAAAEYSFSSPEPDVATALDHVYSD